MNHRLDNHYSDFLVYGNHFLPHVVSDKLYPTCQQAGYRSALLALAFLLQHTVNRDVTRICCWALMQNDSLYSENQFFLP